MMLFRTPPEVISKFFLCNHLCVFGAFTFCRCLFLLFLLAPSGGPPGSPSTPPRMSAGIFVNFCAHAIYAAQSRSCKNQNARETTTIQTEPQNTKNLEYGQWPEKMHKHFCSSPFLLWAAVAGSAVAKGIRAGAESTGSSVFCSIANFRKFCEHRRRGRNGGRKRHVRSNGRAPYRRLWIPLRG